MTRDEIYDHLAQVYLGKRKGADHKKKKELNVWLVINIVITVLIFASVFYGLTAFLAKRSSSLQSNIMYALHNGPIRVTYNLQDPFPPIKTFSLSVPKMDISKYANLSFSLRGEEAGYPGIVRVVIRNERNESASYYARDIHSKWENFKIPLSTFDAITDWTNITDVSFVLEAWNVEKKRGNVLIDNICFLGVEK